MKTALEWFQELPQPWRDAAIRHTVNQSPEQNMLILNNPTGKDALEGSFVWEKTPEDHDAWEGLAYALAESLPLPEYPERKLRTPEPEFTISEIAAYLSGWQGSEDFPASYHNALAMLRDSQDGIVAQRERGILNRLMP